MSATQQSTGRPISAAVVPLALVLLAVLDSAALFSQNRVFANDGVSTLTYFIGTISIAVQAVAGVLVASRISLGRAIYAFAMPVIIIASVGSAWLSIDESTVPNIDPAAAIVMPLLLSVVIYGVLLFFLFRPALSQWLHSSDSTEAQAVPTSQPPFLKFLNSLSGRLTFLFVLVTVLVFVFGAPVEMIYFYVIAVPVMLLLRFWFKRRS